MSRQQTPSISLSALATFNPRTIERLPEGSQTLHALQGLPLAVVSIAHLCGFCDDAPTRPTKEDGNLAFSHAMSFPLNAAGAPWIERYLTEMVKPFVSKWSAQSDPVTYDKEDNAPHRIYMAGMVWGQCLAQELNLQWVEDPKDPLRPHLISADDSVPGKWYPWWKPAKFAHLGKQDSLVQYLTVMRHHEHNMALLKAFQDSLQERSTTGFMKKVHTYQIWHDEAGRLEGVILLNKKGKVIQRHKLVVTGGETPQ